MGARDEEADYPCPACGSTLYGWTAAHDPLDRARRIVLDRCETCGLAVTREARPPDVDREIDPLLKPGPDGGYELVVPNRRSFSGGIGGAQWAGLEPELHRLHLNPESLRLLLRKRGLEVSRLRTPYGRESRGLMIQTFLNAFTFRDNFLRNARAGRFDRLAGGDRWLVRLDWLVSVLVYVPALVLGSALEAVASILGRGGVMEIEATRVG